MPYRILHIIPTLDRSGAEKQLALLASGLPRDEFEVHVCALTRGGPLAEELANRGIPVAVIEKRWKADPMAWWRLRRHIAGLRPDLVHTWLFAANSYGRTAARSAGVRRLIASERCVDSWKAWHELAIDRRLARRTDRIVANGEGVRDFYLGQGIASEILRVIPNGVPPAPPATMPRDKFLEELELPAGARLIAAIGRLWPQKRFKDLIWAADILKIIRDDFHLLIIGDGPQRMRLERFCDEVRVADRVHFLGHRGDVPGLMPHFDLLWVASDFEGMSNVIMEAMAAAVPVVATDIPGNRELVVHGQTGYLVPVGDRPAFTKYANQLFDEPDLAHRLGAAARQRMLTEFSVEKMVQAHAALYRELLRREG